jgi:surface protein
MFRKIIVFIGILFYLISGCKNTLSKYYYNISLDVAQLRTMGNYYLITYTEKNSDTVKIEKVYKNENYDIDGSILRKWIFNNSRKLETIKIEDNSGYIEDTSYLFGGSSELAYCPYLKKIDLSNFNTENVTDMQFMFWDAEKVEEIDLTNLKTDKVTNFSYMFNACLKLTSLDLRSFNTKNASKYEYMFCYCRSLNEIRVNSSTWTINNENGIFEKANVNYFLYY